VYDQAAARAAIDARRKPDLVPMNLVAFEPKAALRVGEGIVSGGRLESRIAWRLSVPTTPEEAVKGLLNPAQGILKNLAVNAVCGTDPTAVRLTEHWRQQP
jgi:hypothetical protein